MHGADLEAANAKEPPSEIGDSLDEVVLARAFGHVDSAHLGVELREIGGVLGALAPFDESVACEDTVLGGVLADDGLAAGEAGIRLASGTGWATGRCTMYDVGFTIPFGVAAANLYITHFAYTPYC